MADVPTEVVAFRVKSTEATALDKHSKKSKIVNVRSGHQLARKIVLDFLKGRLVYVNREDMLVDPKLEK
jgi:hypothetical protein